MNPLPPAHALERTPPWTAADVIAIFLDNAEVVRDAIADQSVADAWQHPAALDGMTVGGLAAHLGEASIRITLRTLHQDRPVPSGPLLTAADYYARASEMFTPDDHDGFRTRAGEMADEGHGPLVVAYSAGLVELRRALADPGDQRIVPALGTGAMMLDEYLLTRLVEQVVHLDDLARSLGVDWSSDARAEELVIRCGVEIGYLRFGRSAMLRALYRGDTVGLPVL